LTQTKEWMMSPEQAPSLWSSLPVADDEQQHEYAMD
jgi:hypothetical protein